MYLLFNILFLGIALMAIFWLMERMTPDPIDYNKPTLHKFFVELDSWVKAGALDGHPIFKRSEGVCSNLSRYLSHYRHKTGTVVDGLYGELSDIFERNYKDAAYPFAAKDPQQRLSYAAAADVVYKNPLRVNFIDLAAKGLIKGI